MKKLYCIILLLQISVFAFSQWTWQNPLPDGNSMRSVYFTDSNTGYAVGPGGSIRKTIDDGTTWSALYSGTTENLLSVYFTDSNTGYVSGTHGIILKTIDGGATWTTLMSGTTWPLYSITFVNANIGYAVGGDKANFLELF